MNEILAAKIERIKAARDLFLVRDLLNSLIGFEADEVEQIARATRTYGGTEIDLPHVYSWDRFDVLVKDEDGDFVLVPRASVLS